MFAGRHRNATVTIENASRNGTIRFIRPMNASRVAHAHPAHADGEAPDAEVPGEPVHRHLPVAPRSIERETLEALVVLDDVDHRVGSLDKQQRTDEEEEG